METPETSPSNTRGDAIAVAMQKIRACMREHSEQEALEEVRNVLVQLASNTELWAQLKMEPRAHDRWETLSVDGDGQYQLALWMTSRTVSTVPHDHGGSWAVVAGIKGEEKSIMYGVHPGLHVLGEVSVGSGVGHIMHGDDVHSVVMKGTEENPVIQLHLYGQCLDSLKNRRVYNALGVCTRVDGDAVPSLTAEFQLLSRSKL